MLQARRGILKGLAAVVLGVATSLPALKHDPAPPGRPKYGCIILWEGKIEIPLPKRVGVIRGFKDSFH